MAEGTFIKDHPSSIGTNSRYRWLPLVLWSCLDHLIQFAVDMLLVAASTSLIPPSAFHSTLLSATIIVHPDLH
ncbi:hypothetical protein BDV38DRAFT_242605 [Aspergillus pseudotamarii]|uniref:Uncharacterized protein n=1 Tax=Aspergillus pseudotamarii TaxID=132259 RepID=A0A5N6T147_ASPPS|nr:uncharacterized protein BDV38DRAFT_242605 [Aspergillus pseudotamarii]KAE8139404.1 hypothetical protein BDV38DRAFT_242605 [Aspergillus pseudotamarii]